MFTSNADPVPELGGLRHEAFVYGSDDQFTEYTSRFLTDGLERGAATVAVTSRANWGLLCDAMGERASDVEFTDRDRFYVRPAKAIARYDATLRHHLGKGAPSVCLLAEVQFGPSQAEWDEWTAYEAIANRAFADKPAWIVCPYDARALSPGVLEGAWRTHPNVIAAEGASGAEYDGDEHLLRTLTPRHEALLELQPLPRAADAQAFRDLLAARLTADDVPAGRKLDMLVAANEVFANALVHGRGVAMVRTGTVEGRFVCEISDAGAGLDDPFAGFLPPKSDDEPGVGLWVARQLTWRVDMITSPRGLTVRLWS
jgi:anti-sigma regulatory factor (Ser/Thr protein kinase)